MLDLANQHLAWVELQRIPGQFSPSAEIVGDFDDTRVVPGDRVVARDMPFDVLGQEGLNTLHIIAGVHGVLCPVQPIKDRLCVLWVHSLGRF